MQKSKGQGKMLPMASHSLQLAAEEFRKIHNPKNTEIKGQIFSQCHAGIQLMAEGY